VNELHVKLFNLSGQFLCDLIWPGMGVGIGTLHYYYWYAFTLKGFCQCSLIARV